MADYKQGLHLIPGHMHSGITEYVERGLAGGDFLMTLLRHGAAYGRADTANSAAINSGHWREFLSNYMPFDSYGTPEFVAAWLERGGLGLSVAPKPMGENLPKIFVFINSGHGTDWISGCAIAEDGHHLAGHVSSSENFFRHDMGLTSDWKHTEYKAHYPDGYELVEVDARKPHDGLDAAYQKNQELAAATKQEQIDNSQFGVGA